MGAHGKGVLRHTFPGSVTEWVLGVGESSELLKKHPDHPCEKGHNLKGQDSGKALSGQLPQTSGIPLNCLQIGFGRGRIAVRRGERTGCP